MHQLGAKVVEVLYCWTLLFDIGKPIFIHFHSNPKERQWQRVFRLPHNYTLHMLASELASMLMLKILQSKLQPRQHVKMHRCHFANKVLSSQSYGFSSNHVQMWELDNKEDCTQNNWCFQIMVLEKTLESPLDCKEIKQANPKGNQPWIFIGRTNAEADAPILWPPDAKNSWVIGKDPDAGKNWGKEEETTEDERVGQHHGLNGHEFEKIPGDSEWQECLACCSPWGCKEWDTIAWLMNNNWNTFLNNCGYIIHNSNAHFLTFFANDLLLAVYFIFILDYRNDVRQKANWSDFFIWVQNGL